MSVRSDYPELVRISNGMGVHILEDAEDQARRALDELARLRAAAAELLGVVLEVASWTI